MFTEKELLDAFEKGQIDEKLKRKVLEERKKNFILNDKEKNSRKIELKSRPTTGKISLSASCNQRCIFCGVAKKIPEKANANALFPSSSVKIEWLKIIPYLKICELFREGESFLNNEFLKYARFAKNMGDRIYI